MICSVDGGVLRTVCVLTLFSSLGPYVSGLSSLLTCFGNKRSDALQRRLWSRQQFQTIEGPHAPVAKPQLPLRAAPTAMAQRHALTRSGRTSDPSTDKAHRAPTSPLDVSDDWKGDQVNQAAWFRVQPGSWAPGRSPVPSSLRTLGSWGLGRVPIDRSH